MRLRLLLSFGLVIFIALGSVFLFANFTAEQQVRRYLGRSALAGVDDLVEELQNFYNDSSSWEGVSAVFEEPTIEPTPTTSLITSTTPTTATPLQTITPQHAPGSGEGKGPGGKGQRQATATSTFSEIIPTEITEEIIISSDPVITPEATRSQWMNQGLGQGKGQGKAGHILTNDSGVILYSPDETLIGEQVSDEIINESIPIEEKNQTVAYLIPSGGVPNLPENYETNLIQQIKRATLMAAVISGFIAIILALLLSRTILKPVKALSVAADSLSEGDLSQRVTLRGKNELVSLGNTFNQMAEALQSAEQQRRAMTADIAHELRTPLAVQRANLEALQDGIYPLDLNALEPVIEQNQLLARLVDDLRTLALADSGELSLNLRPFEIADVCKSTISQFESMLGSSNIQINQDYPQALPRVMADPERTSQILTNLLQNAYRYTHPNSTVYIATVLEENMVKVSVRDQGPGIPADSLEKIFERFYRTSKGRERQAGGTGLGLSIARKLAEAQGGSLIASNHHEGGAIFEFRLPVESA